MSIRQFADLSGRRAVVTGASSGIGRAIAVRLAQAGADVLVHCRANLEGLDATLREIRAVGRETHSVTADLADDEALQDLIEAAWNWQGGVDVWINNAGADLLTGDGPGLSFARKLETLFAVDVRGTMLLARMAGERMLESGSGTILNIGWDQADRGMEGDSGELFAASKNAIMGFTRSLAVSLAPRVRVNCIAPGWIRTAWGDEAGDLWQQRVRSETPLGRWGTPDDIANLARFLVSSDADYITGQVINANGGAVR